MDIYLTQGLHRAVQQRPQATATLCAERRQDWDAALVADPVQDRLQEIIAARRKGRKTRKPKAAEPAPRAGNVIDIMEALLADLPGDQRERLQDALGHNPMATPLVDVTPAELLQNYAGSAAEKKMLAWKSDPLKQHRAGLAVTALRAHLEQNSKTADVRRSNVARTSLGQLLPQLKERWALPLVETMKKLGITPIRPQ